MNIDLGPKSFTANAAIAPYRIVAAHTVEYQVVQSGVAPANMLGVNSSVQIAANETCDVQMIGNVEVEAGGTYSFGAKLTSDSSGRAVAATAGQHFIGIAMSDATVGAIVPMFVTHGELET